MWYLKVLKVCDTVTNCRIFFLEYLDNIFYIVIKVVENLLFRILCSVNNIDKEENYIICY